MPLSIVNKKLLAGQRLDPPDLPALHGLSKQKFQFTVDFGLPSLPLEPGLILLRGARQYGKSTWLESQLKHSHDTFGPGSCFYLNGDDIPHEQRLFEECSDLISLFAESPQKRIFIDEITAVDRWQTAIKRLWDKGLSRDVLIITTGSHAQDLLQGGELLPGRKGRLARSTYLFTPLSFGSFSAQTQLSAQERVITYLLSGGSPIACNALLERGFIEPYVIEVVRDWILGAIARSGRDRSVALSILRELHIRGGAPVSMTKVAQEAGAANNTVIMGYIDLFESSLLLHRSYPLNLDRGKIIPRKESKFHFINLLGAVTFSPVRLYSVSDWQQLEASQQGMWLEWLVAQELWRRAMINGVQLDDPLPFVSLKDREIDFMADRVAYEVKPGPTSPEEFLWFHRLFPKKLLTVISASTYETSWCRGITMEQFLLEGTVSPPK